MVRVLLLSLLFVSACGCMEGDPPIDSQTEHHESSGQIESSEELIFGPDTEQTEIPVDREREGKRIFNEAANKATKDCSEADYDMKFKIEPCPFGYIKLNMDICCYLHEPIPPHIRTYPYVNAKFKRDLAAKAADFEEEATLTTGDDTEDAEETKENQSQKRPVATAVELEEAAAPVNQGEVAPSDEARAVESGDEATASKKTATVVKPEKSEERHCYKINYEEPSE